ncbi:uncharacterized protein TRAVEDRAFT_133561 [Trametes versicolor FP-101664 SS1]|uniref:uncharacterized protein n=1 Tax=Trametes versicolor (strain FP-101664) TaxID=717944 RepID=UPI0004622C3A|nr:uncharacterized protein TRAVEDRAFT_133561 [Trametes versicolor FP-101664 SS1]EIW53511.1 hypothetical protein TRAVEDRAFT_133561 [Trametes versicolor FP-101664 SS1]
MQDATGSSQPALPLPAFILFTEAALACIMATLPLTPVRIAASVLLLCACAYGAVSYTLGKPDDDYSLGSSLFGTLILNTILFTWLIPDPLRDIRYLKEGSAPLTEKPLLTRIWYAVCIHHNWRLIGTNAQVANVPPPFRGTRARYLLLRLRQICVCLVMLDLIESFVHSHPHLYTPGVSDAHFPPGAAGYLMRSGCMAVWLMNTYTTIKLSYSGLSFVVVALFLWAPADWPDLFGNWSDAYTVRRLWGRVWHQVLRRHFSHWGKAAVRTLHIPRGTFLSSQIQVHAAFLASALLHCLGDVTLGHSVRYFGRVSLAFFLVNAAGITFEDGVIALARRAGVPRAPRVLGYVWVCAWFTWAARFYQEPIYAAGLGQARTLPWSPTMEVVVPFV